MNSAISISSEPGNGQLQVPVLSGVAGVVDWQSEPSNQTTGLHPIQDDGSCMRISTFPYVKEKELHITIPDVKL
jgi:hypothetical protein